MHTDLKFPEPKNRRDFLLGYNEDRDPATLLRSAVGFIRNHFMWQRDHIVQAIDDALELDWDLRDHSEDSASAG